MWEQLVSGITTLDNVCAQRRVAGVKSTLQCNCTTTNYQKFALHHAASFTRDAAMHVVASKHN